MWMTPSICKRIPIPPKKPNPAPCQISSRVKRAKSRPRQTARTRAAKLNRASTETAARNRLLNARNQVCLMQPQRPHHRIAHGPKKVAAASTMTAVAD